MAATRTDPEALAVALRDALAAAPRIGADELAGALELVPDAPAAARLVESLLGRPGELSDVAARSYAHVNGFDKLVLLSSAEPEFELRLHLWWPERGPEDRWGGAFRTHDHRWDYASALLCGSFRFRWYEVSPAGEGRPVHEYEYRSPGRGSHCAMRRRGSARARCVFDARLGAGNRYSLSRWIQHQVSCEPGELGASLVLRGPARRDATRVYTDAPVPGPERIPVERLDAAQLEAKLRGLLARLRS